MTARLLGIDVGTTSVKVQAFTDAIEPLEFCRTPYSSTIAGARFEQDADEIWAAVVSGIRTLGALISLSDLVGIGVDGQAPTLVFVTAAGDCLTPCLGWRDVRANAEASELAARFPAEWRAAAFNAIMPVTGSWSPARTLWFARHRPVVLDQAAYALSIKDLVVYRMTGVAVTDAVNARGFVNAPGGQPVSEIVDYSHAAGLLPRVLEPWACAGEVSQRVASDLGLPPRVRVSVGWGDLFAAILSAGAMDREGSAFDITGTAEGIGVSGPGPVAVGGLVSMPVDDALCITYGSTQAGCGAVDWWLAAGGPGANLDPAVADELAWEALDRPPTVLFMPHLGGERAPLWDTEIRGAFLGLELHTDWSDLSRSVLEGVAFSIRQVLELAESAIPSAGPVHVAGAAAGSSVWNQIKADILGRQIKALQTSEASVLGAAMLGAVAAGLYGSLREASDATNRRVVLVEPRPSRATAYNLLYDIYRRAQSDLRGIHRDLGELRESAWPVERKDALAAKKMTADN